MICSNTDHRNNQEAGRRIAVKEIFRELGISGAAFYHWKAKYGGMEASDVARPRELAKENAEFRYYVV